jgi:preprotein translocase subunit SecB
MEAHTHPTLSPLQLNRYFIKKLAFALNEGFDRRGRPTSKELRATVTPPMGVDVESEQNPDNESQWRFELTVELSEPEDHLFPYRVMATIVGYFTVDRNYPKQDAANLARVSGASILYSTVREIVANVTSRTHYPHLVLPTVTFLDLPELEETPAQKRTRKAKTSGKPPSKKRALKRGSQKKKM